MRERKLCFLRTGNDETRPWILLGMWIFAWSMEGSTLCILFPFTWRKDDFGGRAVSCYQALFQSFVIRCTLIPLLLFLLTEKKNVSIEQTRIILGEFECYQCFLLNVNSWRLLSSVEVECMFSLCTARSWFRSSLCWWEAETGQGNSFDDEIRGSQADCLLAFREPYKLRATPSPV